MTSTIRKYEEAFVNKKPREYENFLAEARSFDIDVEGIDVWSVETMKCLYYTFTLGLVAIGWRMNSPKDDTDNMVDWMRGWELQEFLDNKADVDEEHPFQKAIKANDLTRCSLVGIYLKHKAKKVSEIFEELDKTWECMNSIDEEEKSCCICCVPYGAGWKSRKRIFGKDNENALPCSHSCCLTCLRTMLEKNINKCHMCRGVFQNPLSQHPQQHPQPLPPNVDGPPRWFPQGIMYHPGAPSILPYSASPPRPPPLPNDGLPFWR